MASAARPPKVTILAQMRAAKAQARQTILPASPPETGGGSGGGVGATTPIVDPKAPLQIARMLVEQQFTTDVRRTATMIGFGQAMIELALDTGNVHREGAKAAISEAELELKHGDRAAVYQLARRLADTVPFRFDPTPKSARGYALADGSTPEVAHADTPPLEEGKPSPRPSPKFPP